MTYIPGTGPVPGSKKTDSKNNSADNSRHELFSAVNVKELKHPEEFETPETEWYLQIKSWMIMGGILSVVFAAFAFLDIKFLFLLPLGPYAGYLGWHIRKWIKKHTEKFDSLA